MHKVTFKANSLTDAQAQLPKVLQFLSTLEANPREVEVTVTVYRPLADLAPLANMIEDMRPDPYAPEPTTTLTLNGIPVQPKRGRGRPPGAKNKPKVQPTATNPQNETADDGDAAVDNFIAQRAEAEQVFNEAVDPALLNMLRPFAKEAADRCADTVDMFDEHGGEADRRPVDADPAIIPTREELVALLNRYSVKHPDGAAGAKALLSTYGASGIASLALGDWGAIAADLRAYLGEG